MYSFFNKFDNTSNSLKMKIKQMNLLMLMASLVFLQSCITMSTATVSNVKPTSGKEATASVGGMGILALTVPRDLAPRAVEELRQKGVTGNISTTLTVRNWLVVQYYRVVATGTTDK
jgi:hypothetical protein